MGLQVNIKKAFGELREQLAGRLIVAAVTLANEHQKRLSIGNPAPHNTPSKPGEYPRLITGFGRAQTGVEPMSVPEVTKTLTVRIGLREAGWYLEHLSENRGRLGMLETFEAMKPRLEVLIGSPA